ncbi:uncharacterized protein LOC114748544 [Neltuma alba]|uniref:uncharacterized protein LOC114748544 n=1 Tax=Neltuma alba TaxID=207710 RepID=UPI0010A36BA0|nr:uncharacterized protein LOC114748544 [Prosopis alba]
MLNLTRFSKRKNNVVGRFKHDASCKRHPKHHQSPGVCSLCLRERLAQLSSSSTSRAAPPSSAATSSSVSSLSSYYSSSCSSSCASPSEAKTTSSISIFLFNAKHGLIKSRSMAAASRRRDAIGGDDTAGKSRGFLFNLLRPRHKKPEHRDTHDQLVRCTSVRQNVTVAS